MTIDALLAPHGAAAWLLLCDSALGRGDLDRLYREKAPPGAPQPKRLQRHQVVGAVVGYALQQQRQGDASPLAKVGASPTIRTGSTVRKSDLGGAPLDSALELRNLFTTY